MHVTELPDDVLYTIFPYLTAWEFLSFTGSTRTLLRLQETSAFWRPLTLKTFRIPPQPLLEGSRWHWLYRKLLTQTKLYTWGSNRNDNLGRATTLRDGAGGLRGWRCSGWPRQPQLDDEQVGIVADVQCGDLTFPPAYPLTTRARYEASTAIKQLSTGRGHILGLSDDGKVWSWTNEEAALIKPLHVDLRGHEVKTVAAGWDRSSMYVQDIGIVYWAPVRVAVPDVLHIDTVTIPGTSFRRKASGQFPEDSLEARIGEVITYVVLEAYIVFITHLNKIFSYPTTYPMPAIDMSEPVELTTFADTPSAIKPFQILDLQGSFRNFAVFTSSNQILIANRELLDGFHDAQISEETSFPRPTLLESSPQCSRIVSLAFGDHHTHALHEDGTISSWGSASEKCGALGLGDEGVQEVRGLLDNHTRNTHLPRHRAKTVWFEPLMERWLSDVYRKAGELRLLDVIETFEDHYEKEGANWEPNVNSKDREMGAYFALKVAAGGWSSAALVLVDEEFAERARQEHIVKPSTPPSDGDSGAEYEYGDSPFDMVEMALNNIFVWIRGTGRWFLGLTERDTRLAEADGVQGAQAGDEGNEVQYTWSEDPIPVEKIRAMRDTS